MRDDDTLREWVLRFRDERDPEAVARLFDATAPWLAAVARRLVERPEEVEELLQATYLGMIEGVDRYDPARPVSAWLAGILVNQHRYASRRGARTLDPEAVAPPPEPAQDPPRAVEDREAREALRAAVERLPELYRSVFELSLAHGLGPAEIAARLGRSPGAVRVQLHRGLARLRDLIPAGVALSAAFVAMQGAALAEVRRAVVRRAATPEAGIAAGGAGVLAKVAGVVVAGAAVVGIAVSMTSDPVDPARPAAATAARTAAPAVAPPPATEAVGAGEVSAAEPLRVGVTGDAEAPDAAPTGVRTGEVFVVRGDGVSFAAGEVVDPAHADVVFTGDFDVEARAPAAAARVPFAWGDHAAEEASNDARLRAIVSFEPAALPLRSERRLDLEEDPGAVRTAGGGYAVFAVVDVRYVPARRRNVSHVRFAFHAAAPRFRERTVGSVQGLGVVVDPLVLPDDPWARELERRRRAFLDAIDRDVRAAAAVLPPGVPVRGVAFRRAAAEVTRVDRFDYVASTFSFEHDTRDDRGATRNDWELALRSFPDSLDVWTVTDDRSVVYPLGAVPIEAFHPERVRGSTPREDERVGLAEGASYLIHTIDTETDRWDLVEVARIETGRWVVFRWRELEAEERGAVARLAPSRLQLLRDGNVRLRLRGGAGGGNAVRAFLDGSTNHLVDEVVAAPIDVRPAVDIHEPYRAWIDGGRIPPGTRWRILRVEHWATTRGDSNGPGGMRVVVGDAVLADVPESDDASTGVWEGDLVLRPGDERRAFVEIRNSTAADVRVLGSLEADDG